MHCPTLTTYVAESSVEVREWAQRRWAVIPSNLHSALDHSDNEMMSQQDWWVVKASCGNGGRDIWIIHAANYNNVIATIPSTDCFVIQKYVSSPLLYKNKKFHFRCYSMCMSDMSAYFYDQGFILTAGYDYCDTDESVKEDKTHISNMSVNKHIPGYPGQISCNLAAEYPEVYHFIA